MRRTINLDCKTHHISKDGSFPLLLRVNLNGEQGYFNTGKRILAKFYDFENKKIRKGIKGAGSYDQIITIHKTRIESIIEDFDKKDQVVSLAKVKELYEKLNGNVKSKCFHKYVEERLSWEIENNKIKKWTGKFYGGQARKLKKYKPKVSVYDIDEKFVDEYATYIRKTLGHSLNSVYHAKSFLRKYTNRLFKDGLISIRPFDTIEVGSPVEVELQYLQPKELTLLHDLYDSGELLKIIKVKKSKYARDFTVGESYQQVLRYFLVSCYTGFRHSDIKTFRRENIIGNEVVKKLIKGKEGNEPTVRIPIEKRLFSLLDMNNPMGDLFTNPVFENSQTNKHLRKIMEIAKIEKHITFHKARYTFGIISLLLGMKTEVIQDILGHRDLKTTLRYVKVVELLRKSEMKKWNNLDRLVTIPEAHISINCNNCRLPILSMEQGALSQKKIQCTCKNCGQSDVYEIIQEMQANY